jgi:predicted enzyme related to lactoylglutathione lyase
MHPFTYLELHTTAPDKAKDFYRRLFDWSTSDVQVPAAGFTYTEIDTREGPPAGLRPAQLPASGSHWLAYVKVSDLAAATQKARSLGAEVLREGVVVEGAGSYSVLLDPTGAPLGLWQPVAPR